MLRTAGGCQITRLLALSSTSFLEGGSEQCIFLVTRGFRLLNTQDVGLTEGNHWDSIGGG